MIRYFEKRASILLDICNYVVICSECETYSSVIGNLLNAYLPAGYELYKNYVSNLNYINEQKNIVYINYILNIEKYFSPLMFYASVETLKIMNNKYYNSMCKYCWLYTAFDPYTFFCVRDPTINDKEMFDYYNATFLSYYKQKPNIYGYFNELTNIYY